MHSLKIGSKTITEQANESKFSTEAKVHLRENWNKPLIKFLSKNISDRLVYMGLPSPDADDVKHWLEFIKIVIAFQCREYNKPSDPMQSRKDVEKLEALLREMEREQKLESYVVYDGYMEEVVLRERDNSPHAIQFDNQKFVTLYNLDFCNDISSPLEFTDQNGDLQSAFKFDAIKKMLSLQKTISKKSDKFIFLLTVHCNYKGKELQNFLNNSPNLTIKTYLAKYNRLSGTDKNSRIVRLFVTHLIHQYFPTNDFSPKILPVIRYHGIQGTPLLHFVILGIHTPTNAGAIPMYQQFEDVINQKFVDINTSSFLNSEEVLEGEKTVIMDPVKFFTQSKTFENLWKK